MDKLSSIGSLHTKFHSNWSIKIVFLLILAILWSETIHQSNWVLIPIEIRINNSCFLSLICPVEHLQDVPPNQLVIGINMQRYWIFSAVEQRPKVMVGQSCDFLRIWYQSIVLFVDLVELQILFVNLNASVSRTVINDDGLEVGIVLHENGMQIVLYSKFCVVVISWNKEAEW